MRIISMRQKFVTRRMKDLQIWGIDMLYHSTNHEDDPAFCIFLIATDQETLCEYTQRVIIKDDVEIGAGCTIDRGVSHDTVIGQGTKMDNMIHIGHDTVVGRNCLIAAQVGIAGVVTLEDGVTLWGQVGVSKTLTIGSNATILAQSGVGKDTEGGKAYFGSPIEDARDKMKELVWVKRIPELWEKVMGKK